MKRKYEKPNMDLEMFEANEYIAACDTCNGESGLIYEERNGVKGYQGIGKDTDRSITWTDHDHDLNLIGRCNVRRRNEQAFLAHLNGKSGQYWYQSHGDHKHIHFANHS